MRSVRIDREFRLVTIDFLLAPHRVVVMEARVFRALDLAIGSYDNKFPKIHVFPVHAVSTEKAS